MKRTYPETCRKSFSAVLLLLVTALLAGCVPKTADSARFNAISAHLEPGGSNYAVWNSASLFSVLERRALKFERDLQSSKLSAAGKAEMQRKLVLFRLLWEISGLRDLQGIGASSVKVAQEYYRSRVFAAMPPDAEGLLNNLVSKQSSPRDAVIGELPASVQYVVAADLSLKAVIDAFVATGDVGIQFVSQLALPKNVDLSVLNKVNGYVVLAFARKAGHAPEDEGFMLSFPDEKGELFEAVINALRLQSRVDKKSKRMELPGRNGDGAVICHKDGRMYFYSDAQGEKIFALSPDVPRLKDDKDFIKWNTGLPEAGCAFLYIRSGAKVFGEKFLPDSVVLTREKDGLLLVRNSSNDFSGEAFELLLNRWQKRLLTPIKGIDVPAEVRKKKSVQPDKKAVAVPQIDCRKNMLEIFKELKAYAGKNGGAFPAEAGLGGLKKLRSVNVQKLAGSKKYFYLGYNKNFAAEKNIPLLIDSRSHSGRICVLYTDGVMRHFDLSNPGYCRRVVSFLFTVHRWKMDVFQFLVRQADILDNATLNKE